MGGSVPGAHGPGSFGAEDGDPLDALVCVSEPTFPACLIPVKPIGLFLMRDEKGPDEKMLCVPLHDPAWQALERFEDVPQQLRAEIAHFFDVYKDLEAGKQTVVEGWASRADAVATIDAARRRRRDVAAEVRRSCRVACASPVTADGKVGAGDEARRNRRPRG